MTLKVEADVEVLSEFEVEAEHYKQLENAALGHWERWRGLVVNGQIGSAKRPMF